MTSSPKARTHPQTAAHLPPHQRIAEPLLLFGPGLEPRTHQHPLLGLLRHGPYAQPPGLTAVRVATITVHGQRGRLFDFLRGLSREHLPTDRKTYVPAYPGFEAVFGLPLLPSEVAHVELPEGAAGTGTDGHERLAEVLGRAMLELNAARDSWDVVVFLLPSAWERWRESLDGKFNLHDRLKAAAAPLGCPVQMLREDSALAYTHSCSLAWRLSIAVFAKAGGVPWRIAATTRDDTAYVGLAYAIRGGTADEFVTCCSQVFDSEGGGMEFVAYNIGANRDLENPHLTREEMRAVMARSAQLYQHRHAGRMPSRLVVHKTTRWRDEEVDGVLDAWSAAADIECLTVSRTPWRGVLLDPGNDGAPSKPHRGPVARGTFQQLSGRAGLLWVSGNALQMSVRGGPYNPSVKGLPRPALLSRDAGSGSLELAAKDVLALSKLDWNNDAPFDLVPVTIGYSQRLARVISHVPHLPDNVYQYRLFM